MKYLWVFIPVILGEDSPTEEPTIPSIIDDNGDPILPNEDSPFSEEEGGLLDPWRTGPEEEPVIIHANPEDFAGDGIVNHSALLVHARFSLVDNHDDGNEIDGQIGTSWSNFFHADNCINGNVYTGHTCTSCHCLSEHRTRGTGNFITDIAEAPSVSFIKIWPPAVHWIGRYVWFNTYRVFIDDEECFPIENYTIDRAIELRDERGSMIFTCPDTVENAAKLRVASPSSWIGFNEIEIFENLNNDCPVKSDEECGHDEIHNQHKCHRFTCGKPVPNHQSCSHQTCSCLRNGVPTEYNYPVCNCPEGREGNRCQVDSRDLPCASNPCNSGSSEAAQSNSHICKNIVGDEENFHEVDYRCYCVDGFTGKNCETPPLCKGPPCTGNGDVHYNPFDGHYFDNMGFCQYVITTNGGCNNNWPLDASNEDFRADDPDQDFFMVVGMQAAVGGNHARRVSKLTGLQIYWRPRSNNVLYRLTTHRDYDGWLWEGDSGANPSGISFETLSTAGYIRSGMNFVTNVGGQSVNLHLALRTNVINNQIYIGAGTISGDTNWSETANSRVLDYLLHIVYTKGGYPDVRVSPNCILSSKVCGICGNYDGAIDFDRPGTRVEWERALERRHYWDNTDGSAGARTEQCPYTDRDGNRVPTEAMEQASHGRRKRETMNPTDCQGDYNTVLQECNKLDMAPFNTCDIDPSTRIAACIVDACLVPGDIEEFVCATLQAHVAECNNSGANNRIESWRTNDLCPLACGANAHFESCTSQSCWPSVTSCTVDQDECDTSNECVEGCFCNAGYISDGQDCILDDGNQCQEEQTQQLQAAAAALSPCGSQPCRNGGLCEHTYNGGNAATGYTCNCDGTGFAGEKCTIPLSVPTVVDLLAQLLPDDSSVEADDFLSHGCYCPRLDGLSRFHGAPISDVDRLCQRLAHCETCSADSECGGTNGFPFNVRVNNGVGCDENNNNACQQATCACAMETVRALIDLVAVGTEVPYANCVERTPAAGQDVECCGAGSKWMMFSSDSGFVCDVDDDGIPSLVNSSSDRIREF